MACTIRLKNGLAGSLISRSHSAGESEVVSRLGSKEGELTAAEEAGLQVVHMGALEEADAAQFREHPSWLGNCWHDEPTGGFWGKDMEGKFAEFQEYKGRINAAAPGIPVFINDVPWITPPATGWWVKWNTAGDVACHDNYPVMNRKARAGTIGDEENKTGIPMSTSFAAASIPSGQRVSSGKTQVPEGSPPNSPPFSLSSSEM